MGKTSIFFFLFLIYFNRPSESAVGFGPGEQAWGYVDVRPGAHMFYWLYYTTANVASYTERPLAIWLQGGPGASSTGYGNFEELGPLTLEGELRNHTWVKDMNVLFIDNPVGTGFSYVDDLDDIPTDNNGIALDLVELMKGFYANHPEFETVPLHIFCESYGGKMSPEFALELYKAIQRGEIKSNLQSVLLGDPWTSPIDSVNAWGPLLLSTGIVDFEGYERIMTQANRTAELVAAGKWQEATNQWVYTQSVVGQVSKGVDFYNIEKKTRGNAYANSKVAAMSNKQSAYRLMVTYDLFEDRDTMLYNLMTRSVAPALNLTQSWGAQSNDVFERLEVDFMKPYVNIVTELLDKTDLEVTVLTGQLDLICATLGTMKFVDDMDWSYKAEYLAAPRNAISVDGVLEGYIKSSRKFNFVWVNRAGHMVPADNPAAMDFVLRKITKYQGEKPSFL